MWRKVKDLSSDQRLAMESLLGRSLRDDEGLNIQSSRVLQDEPTGEDRAHAWRKYLDHADTLAKRAKDVPAEELDALLDEALDQVRHQPS